MLIYVKVMETGEHPIDQFHFPFQIINVLFSLKSRFVSFAHIFQQVRFRQPSF